MVDPVLIERILGEIKTNIEVLKQAADIDWDVYRSDLRARRFVERTLHVLIEACIDIAQHIIADKKLREPASYRDTFAVLAENGVLNQNDLTKFEKMASFRNLIVHYYERVDDAVVFGVFRKNLADFETYCDQIVEHLKRSG